jgi:hypothetical protein
LTQQCSLPVAAPRRNKGFRNGKSLPLAVPERTRNMKEPISQRVTDLSQLDPLKKSASKLSLDDLDNE